MPSRSFSLLLVLVLLAGGSLGCYKGFCPACAEATPVQRLSYPLQSTFTVGVAIAALAPDPQGGQPQTYAVVDGALPPGLTLDPATGLITGTATTPGLYRATIQAGNLGGAVTEELVFTELSAPSAVSLMASPPNPLYGETSVTVTPAFTGAASAVVGTVPGGNDLSANAVSGTPIPVQASGFTTATTYWLRAANAAGAFVDASLSLAPQPVTLSPISPAGPTLTVNSVTPFSASPVTGGVLDTVTWRASAGSIDPRTGVWTAPPAATKATLTATSNDNGAVTATTLVTVVAAPTASLVASALQPLYGQTSVTVTPAFSGATAVIVGTRPGGDDLAINPFPGAPIPVQASGFTTATTCWLRAANAAGDFVEASLTIAPQTVRLTPVSPADATRTVETVTAFSADVSGGALGTVTWRASAGTIDPGTGAWTAPDAPTTATITAFSDDNGAVTASTSVTVVAAATASLAASSENPLYEQTSVTVTPTFTGAASAVLGTRQGGSELSAHPVSGTPIPIQTAGFTTATTYWLRATNVVGDAVDASLTVAPAPAITTQPLGMALATTQTATFSVEALGQNPLQYQWLGNLNDPASAPVPIPGATSPFYTTPAMPTAGGGFTAQYSVTVTDPTLGTATASSIATLTVGSQPVPPTLTGQPAGGPPTYTVTASSDPATTTFQWYRITPSPFAFDFLAGANTASFLVPPDGNAYLAVASNGQGQAGSLAVPGGSGLVLTGQPRNAYVSEPGETANLQVDATTTAPPLQYQWWHGSPGTAAAATAIPGATGAAYTATDHSPAFYYCVVSDASSTVASDPVALIVGAPATPGILPAWSRVRTPPAPSPASTLSTGAADELTNLWWTEPVPTDNLTVTFTMTLQLAASPVLGDGWSLLFGDPARGVTALSQSPEGAGVASMGAQGLPGLFVLFATSQPDPLPAVPIMAAGRGETWGQPWNLTNFALDQGAMTLDTLPGTTHAFQVSLFNGVLTVLMDGTQVFSGQVRVPPVAYLGFGASTTANASIQTLSGFTATVSAP